MKNQYTSTYIGVLIFLGITHYHISFFAPILLGFFFYLLFSILGEKISNRFNLSKNYISIGLFVAFVLIVSGIVVVGGTVIADNVSLLFSELKTGIETLGDGLYSRIPHISDVVIESTSGDGGVVNFENMKMIVGGAYGLIEMILLTTLLTILFILLEERVFYYLKQKETSIGDYILVAKQVCYDYSLGILSMTGIISFLYFIGLIIFGVQYSVAIALIAGFCALVPTIGTGVGGLITIVSTWILTGDLQVTLGIAGWFVGVQLLEEYFILPKIISKNIEINTSVTLCGMVIFGYARGVLGVFLSAPILATILGILNNNNMPFRYVLGKAPVLDE